MRLPAVHRTKSMRLPAVHLCTQHTHRLRSFAVSSESTPSGVSEEEMIALAITASVSESPIGGPGASPVQGRHVLLHYQGPVNGQASQCETNWGGVLMRRAQ